MWRVVLIYRQWLSPFEGLRHSVQTWDKAAWGGIVYGGPHRVGFSSDKGRDLDVLGEREESDGLLLPDFLLYPRS